MAIGDRLDRREHLQVQGVACFQLVHRWVRGLAGVAPATSRGGGGVRWLKEKWAVGALLARNLVYSNVGIAPRRTVAAVAVETARSVGGGV